MGARTKVLRKVVRIDEEKCSGVGFAFRPVLKGP